MKRILIVAAALAIITFLTGCATPYMKDRARDAADIFTARIGFGAGAKVHIGPLQTGLLFNLDGIGLRGGEFYYSEEIDNPSEDMDYVFGGTCSFIPADYDNSTAIKRNKYYVVTYSFLGIPVNSPFYCRVPNTYSPCYFTNIEVVGGFLWTFRLGFNPGELLDFILGWTTLDIFKDDIETKKKVEQSVAGYPPQGVGSPDP